MPDPGARRLARWLLGKHRLASLGILLACLAPAVLLQATAGGSSWWIVITLGTTVLASGFVQRKSRGLARWSERLPADPGSLWGAQLIWLVVLALPATLAAGLLWSDPGSAGWRGARSTAWLICLGSAFLAPFRLDSRLPFIAGLAAWLVSVELCLAVWVVTAAGVVLHDVVLTAVTLAYVLAFVRRRQDDPFGTGFLIFGIVLLALVPRPATVWVAWTGLAVFGWLALARFGLVPRLTRAPGFSFVSTFGTLFLLIAGWPLWLLLYRLLTDWQGLIAAARLELTYALGAGPLVTPGRLTGTAILFWAVILVWCEVRRLRVVECWMRRRAFLERMPLTRKQFLALVFRPQLRIARFHFMIAVVVGLITAGAFQVLELEGVGQVWRWGGLIGAASVSYLLAAQYLILRRGRVGCLPWIAVFGLPAIVFWSLSHGVFWLFAVAATILVLASVSALRGSPLNPAPDALEQARADFERAQADFERAHAAHRIG